MAGKKESSNRLLTTPYLRGLHLSVRREGRRGDLPLRALVAANSFVRQSFSTHSQRRGRFCRVHVAKQAAGMRRRLACSRACTTSRREKEVQAAGYSQPTRTTTPSGW